jgi:hypothetical protein
MNVLYLIMCLSYFPFLQKKKEIDFFPEKKKISLGLYIRLFSVFNEKDFEYINENISGDLFQDFDCEYNEEIPDRIQPYTLLFFLKNDINWDDECYFYNNITDTCYFPVPNSLIFINNYLEWKGNKKIRVIIGKLN